MASATKMAAPPRTRSRLPRERRVADILAAARQMLSERGYENAVVAEIAERAGVVEGTVYRYFENKRHLFIRVAESWYEEVLRDTQPDLSIRGTFNKLRQLIWRELTIIRQQPALTRFVLMELRPDPAYRSMPVFAMNRKFTSGIGEVLKEGVASGEFSGKIPLRIVRDMIFGGIEHQTWAFLRNEGDFSVENAADAIAEIVFNGLSVRSPATDDAMDRTLARLEQIADRLDPDRKAST